MTEIFIPDDRYQIIAAALETIGPCPFTGRITADELKHALGHADIWPASIRSAIEERERA